MLVVAKWLGAGLVGQGMEVVATELGVGGRCWNRVCRSSWDYGLNVDVGTGSVGLHGVRGWRWILGQGM